MLLYGEDGYLELLQHCLSVTSNQDNDRTGVGRRRMFAPILSFYLPTDFPLMTHRQLPNRMAFEEFWFFLNGRTNTKELEERGVMFWQGNTSRRFLDSRKLTHLPEGSYGKAYGFQLRNFGGTLVSGDSYDGVDQIRNVYEGLREDPFSARHVVTMWNPAQLHQMALPPCWYSHQFIMLDDDEGRYLNLMVNARSADLLFGTPANLFQYGVYLLAMSKLLGVEAGELKVVLTDAHLYYNQIDYTRETVSRRDYTIRINNPKVVINKDLTCLEDLLALEWSDIKLVDYFPDKTPYVSPKPPMAV